MKRLCLLLLALTTAACATTTRGTTDVLVVDSDPPGARVTVSNGMAGTTPATFRLRRKGDYDVTIEKEGFEAVHVHVMHKVGGAGSAGMAGNLILGGLIGAAVDAGSGAMFDLVPNPIRVNLVRLDPEAAPATTPAPVTNDAAPPPPIAPPPPRRTFTAADDRAAASTLEAMSQLAAVLIAYRKSHGDLPPGATITAMYPALARERQVRIADYWENPFAIGRTANGFILVSAGADNEFDDRTWQQGGEQSDLAADAVLRVDGESQTFVRKWPAR
ncbi:MAG TPA: PEGA domain-containing protein [Thermoanaerobaculia bacterium]|jgi:hypothetical protein